MINPKMNAAAITIHKIWGDMEAGYPASICLEERRKMNAVFCRRVDHIAGVLRLTVRRVAFLKLVPFSKPFYRYEDC